MESFHKHIQLILEFLKAPLLVLHISFYTLMTLLAMLSAKLLPMLMILLSILSVIRHLTCGNNLNWLLKLNLIYETLWTGVRTGSLILFWDMFIKKDKFLKVLWHLIHLLKYYRKFNNGHHTELSNLYICWVKVSNLDNFVPPVLYLGTKAIELCQVLDNCVTWSFI